MPEKQQRIKLVSGDGVEIFLDREIALMSGTVKRMLEDRNIIFAEVSKNEISFPEISGKILLEVTKYLFYKWKYSDSTVYRQIPEFPIEPEIALELMMAADYLDC
ncbi:hypothetical protein BB560_002004 [Smittium megazygosporum]|uniref:Elongin-C n=1 Tax=Smittium megazygosporum TaxID=133381 RepID=A0A2T9ZFZ2_9FUNG|nr:hypothetical protein BB560_002004 [Smittium megazygosporum]